MLTLPDSVSLNSSANFSLTDSATSERVRPGAAAAAAESADCATVLCGGVYVVHVS